MEPESSLPHLQEPATCPYPETDRFSPCRLPSSLQSILIVSSQIRLSVPSGVLSSAFPTKTLYASLHSLYHLRKQRDNEAKRISEIKYNVWSG